MCLLYHSPLCGFAVKDIIFLMWLAGLLEVVGFQLRLNPCTHLLSATPIPSKARRKNQYLTTIISVQCFEHVKIMKTDFITLSSVVSLRLMSSVILKLSFWTFHLVPVHATCYLSINNIQDYSIIIRLKITAWLFTERYHIGQYIISSCYCFSL